jgi:hypothetical protein
VLVLKFNYYEIIQEENLDSSVKIDILKQILVKTYYNKRNPPFHFLPPFLHLLLFQFHSPFLLSCLATMQPYLIFLEHEVTYVHCCFIALQLFIAQS